MAYDVEGAKKGQAFGLAVQSAIAAGKEDDFGYIVQQFWKYLQLGKLCGKLDPSQLAAAIQNEKVLEVINQLTEKK